MRDLNLHFALRIQDFEIETHFSDEDPDELDEDPDELDADPDELDADQPPVEMDYHGKYLNAIAEKQYMQQEIDELKKQLSEKHAT